MALINPCSIETTPSNTGSECSDALKAAAMLIMVPKAATWTDTDLLDFTAFLETKIHAAAASRFFPIFGNSAPIRSIKDSPEADVLETMEDGSVQFIRYGMFNRTFMTTEGGLCLARALMAMRNNYAFIEVDITGQVAMMKNADGTYSGFPVNLAYAPVPELANLKTSYKNQFMLSFSPNNYIKKGVVFAGDTTEDILSLRGLYDTAVTAAATTQTTTNIFVNVATICGNTDLIELYAGTLAVPANFIITKVSDGTTQVASAATIVAGEMRLTGTYVSAASYYVALAAPSVLKAAGIEGYEGTVKATVVIP